MKICAYEVRQDERRWFDTVGRELGLTLTLSPQVPSLETADAAAGCEGVTILGQGVIHAGLLQRWHAAGVRYLSTRTVGYNHIDLAAARQAGIQVCRASYPPTGVADYTIMLILMCLRHYKQQLWRGQVNDFSLYGMEGRELHELTVGVWGAGHIGTAVLQELTGFGCRLLACTPHPSDRVRALAQCVDEDTLLRECDVISLHLPLKADTYHIINRRTIARMKDGVVLINCARGGLADMEALIHGIESRKIGALGLDVVEGEEGITHVDHRVDILVNRNMAYLKQFPNVVMTPHMAFYTETAVASMVRTGLEGLVQLAEGRPCPGLLRAPEPESR